LIAPGHFFAHVIDRFGEVALEHEPDGDVAFAFADTGGNFVDPRHAADRLLHRLDHRGGNLVGAGAGQRQADVDGRRIGSREQIDAEIAERYDAEHDQRHDEHRREDRPTNTDVGQHE
jgi:hypothetical protein